MHGRRYGYILAYRWCLNERGWKCMGIAQWAMLIYYKVRYRGYIQFVDKYKIYAIWQNILEVNRKYNCTEISSE